ncbi:MAG: DUF3048 domain-containing protein [Eubacteriales bacterium]|nr:DUF3048 domain-containing protein [Eubacteriales bacterium]
MADKRENGRENCGGNCGENRGVLHRYNYDDKKKAGMPGRGGAALCRAVGIALAGVLLLGAAGGPLITAQAQGRVGRTQRRTVQAQGGTVEGGDSSADSLRNDDAVDAQEADAGGAERNTRFTTQEEMRRAMAGTEDSAAEGDFEWSPLYLTEIEAIYWNFCEPSEYGSSELSLNVVKNGYRNLEELLDNGYTFSYRELADYCEEYLEKKNGVADSFYTILHEALGNPYLQDRPEPEVTATTYNGRDYAEVFDAEYYYEQNPDLQKSVGDDAAALLRHFVEHGIAQGRRGNEAFDVKEYAAQIDADVMEKQLQSAMYRVGESGTDGSKTEPLGKYSYSYANYVGLYLGHYDEKTEAEEEYSADGAYEETMSEIPDEETAAADQSEAEADAETAASDGKSGTESEEESPATDVDPETDSDAEPIVHTGAAPGITTRTSDGVYHETGTRSIYTNEPVSEEEANRRPIAVMMPTDEAAQPSYGIGRADVLYEIMEEGGISRQMAIIPDWQDLERIGNLRSCRLYYLYAAKEWDPILIHFGGVAYMKGVIDADDVDNLSGTYEYGIGGGAPGAGFFFRSDDRKAPHNAYISADGIRKAARQLGYSLSLRDGVYNPEHFAFADGVNDLSQYGAEAESAETIDLSDAFPYTESRLVYNPDDGMYYKYLHGEKQTDALTGEQLSFANVIIQNTKWRKIDQKGYLAFDMLGDQEAGYYCTRGRVIPIRWHKTYDYEPTLYFDEEGNEIELNTGKTYIAVVQSDTEPVFT